MRLPSRACCCACVSGAGFDAPNQFATIGEGDEGESEEDDYGDGGYSGGGPTDGVDDLDILGQASGDTDLI